MIPIVGNRYLSLYKTSTKVEADVTRQFDREDVLRAQQHFFFSKASNLFFLAVGVVALLFSQSSVGKTSVLLG